MAEPHLTPPDYMTPTSDPTYVVSPVMKAVLALGSGAGTSYISTTMANQHSFFPTDFSGWAAAVASTAAALFSLHLLADWWWKKFWRGYFIRRGWIKGKHR